jgi:ABC-2 type transport system permease protein
MSSVGGSLPRYVANARMSASSGIGENLLVVADHLLRLLRVALLIGVWRVVYESPDVVGGMSLAQVLTYTVVSEAFAVELNPRTDIDVAVWGGNVTTRLLRPLSVFGDFASEAAGRWFLWFFTLSVPLLLGASMFGVGTAPESVTTGVLFVVSLALAVIVGLAVDFLFATVLVHFEQSLFAVRALRAGVTGLVSGAVIPLPLLPWGIGTVLSWFPFASMASAPLRIYVGHGSPGELLLGQAAWAAALWLLVRVVWRRSVARMVSYGG